MDPSLILAIIQSILTFGPKAVIAIANSVNIETVTAEEINKLFITKKPEEYFTTSER